MSGYRFKVIVTGRDGLPWIEGCLASIDGQTLRNFDVCVTDDASTDPEQPALVEKLCREKGWEFFCNDTRVGVAPNQLRAIRHLNPSPDDVIVWVDLDDRLAHPGVFDVLTAHYDVGRLLTYGSYRSEPFSATCAPAQPYPPAIVTSGRFRWSAVNHQGILWNHLRTVRSCLVDELTDADFQDAAGEWLPAAIDAAFMFPCLELAGGNFSFITDVLYVYNSENPISEWRIHPKLVNASHDRVLTARPRRPWRGKLPA